MRITRLEEFLIESNTKVQILALLQACFPDYPAHQTYFKQVPHSRFLVYEQNQLIGHAAIEYRMIQVNDSPLKVFLIGDICVHPDFHHKHIASDLINTIKDLAKQHHLDFILVAVSNPSLYLKNGFVTVNNPCRWVIIQNHRTLGVRERSIHNSLMVKQIGNKTWKTGVVDFLGYIV